MKEHKKDGAILMLIGIACLVFASGFSATLAHAAAAPAASTAASSSSTEPVNQDNSHDLIYSTYGYYYLFYVDDGYISYVSSPDAITWSAPDSFLSADGVNEGQAFSTYYSPASNTVYWVVGGGLTSFVVASAQPSSTGGFQSASWVSNTYSDGLGYAVNQPSITFDSLGNTIVAYEGVVPGTSVNVLVDKIAAGTTTLTNLFNWSSGQTTDDWDGKVYPYGSGGAFVLMYSSLHSGGEASPVPAYIEDYTGSSWLAAIELTTYQEATHGNGFTIGQAFYYYGQAEVGSEGVFFTHTLGATTPPIQTVVFPNSLGIDDGYGTLSWDGQNTIVAYYDSGVASPYTIWVSVSTNLGSSWTSPAVLQTSSAEFEPETLGTDLVIQGGVSDVYWALPTSSGSSVQVYGFAIGPISLIAPRISVNPTTLDSGHSAMLSTTTPFSGGTSPYTCQWLAKAPGGGYVDLGASFSCNAGGSPTVSTGTLSTVGAWSFELQVRDSTGASATSSAVAVTVNTALKAPTDSSSPGTISRGQSSTLTSTAVSTGTSPYTYQWNEEAPGGSFTQIAGATSPSYVFSTTGSTATGTWSFELGITDAAGSAVTSGAATVSVSSGSGLTAGVITPSGPTIDSGQSIILTANPSGGTTPYSYRWFSGSSATCSSDTTRLSSTASTQSVNPAVNTYYCYSVTDSASPPSSKSSVTDLVTVHSTLTAGAITPSAPTIAIGKSTTLTAQPSGGTSPYSYQWYSGGSATCSSDTTPLGKASTQSVNPTTSTYYCYRVSDSSTGAPAAGAASATDKVTVSKATTTTELTCTSPVNERSASACTVTVTGAYGSTNGEAVSFKASGSGTFSSGGACILSGGTCSLTYTPTRASGSPQTITATYSGDTNNAGSSGKASIRVT